MMQNKNKTVVKSMALLNLFLHKPSLTLSELVSLTGMPKTSVHRMVSSLEEMGFLSRDASGAYSLGLVFLEFGQLVADRLDIRKIAKPVMEELCREVDEAVQLIMRDGNEAIYVEKIEGTQTVRLYTAIGRRSPYTRERAPEAFCPFFPVKKSKHTSNKPSSFRLAPERLPIPKNCFRRLMPLCKMAILSAIQSSKTIRRRSAPRFLTISARWQPALALQALKRDLQKTGCPI